MLGIMPKAYPDELIYSVLARAYVADGYMIYREFAEDIFKDKRNEPSYEFTGNLKNDVLQQLCVSYGVNDLNEVIRRGTQFPYYTRFYPKQRRDAAYEALITSGKVGDIIRLTTAKEQRFFRYCPLCVAEDRRKYGETYWHRAHQMKGVHCCGVHGIKLLNSNLLMTGKASPNFHNAELSLSDCDAEEIRAPEKEVLLSRYNMGLLEAPIDCDGTLSPLNVICNTLKDKGYVKGKCGIFQLVKIEEAMAEYYKDCHNEALTSVQIRKVIDKKRVQPIDYARIALFLDIEISELLDGAELNFYIAKKVRKNSWGGCTKKDWDTIDDDKYPSVVSFIDEIKAKENAGERPMRITAFIVARHIDISYKSFDKLRKCAAYVDAYKESQEEYWARELVWAYKKMKADGSLICFKGFRTLLNVRRDYIVRALPYIEDKEITDILNELGK